MPRRQLRAAVIGCGRISRPHARAYQAVPTVELVAAADISQAAREGFATEFGLARVYADAGEMLTRERLDIVSVCTWPPHHADPTILACQAGVQAVLCEKPMATHLADADRMLAAARAAGTLLCVNHQRRFNRRYQQARKAIDGGVIGAVTHITGVCGGDLLTDGTHLIDMTRFLAADAPIEWVFGGIDLTRRQNVNLDGPGFAEWLATGKRYGHHVEGGTLAVLHFASGVRATLEIGNVARPGYQKFLVTGTDGRIEISGDRPAEDEPELNIRRFRGRSVVIHRFPREPEPGADRPMVANVAALVRSLRTGQPHLLSGESARTTLEAIMALFAAGLEHRRVDLPYDRSDSPFETTLDRGDLVLA